MRRSVWLSCSLLSETTWSWSSTLVRPGHPHVLPWSRRIRLDRERAPGGTDRREDRGALRQMTAPLRIGVIGVGRFGERHLSAYARQEVQLVGVADSDRDRPRSVAARFRATRWFEDGAELIAACRPDGVSVVTPGRDYLEPTLTALSHGCSVLLEKPVATSSNEVQAIDAAAIDSSA